ncbi:GTPase ObgE, partial [Acinetobacter baumannii]
FEISTVSREGLRELTFAMAEIVAEQRKVASSAPTPARVIIRPQGAVADFTVRVEGGTYGDIYRILGEKPVRWVQQTDFQN